MGVQGKPQQDTQDSKTILRSETPVTVQQIKLSYQSQFVFRNRSMAVYERDETKQTFAAVLPTDRVYKKIVF